MEGYSWHTVSIVTSVLNNHILANVLQTVFPSKSEVCHYSIQQCTGLTNEIIRRKYRQDQGGMLIREDDMAERIMMNVSGPYTKIGKQCKNFLSRSSMQSVDPDDLSTSRRQNMPQKTDDIVRTLIPLPYINENKKKEPIDSELVERLRQKKINIEKEKKEIQRAYAAERQKAQPAKGDHKGVLRFFYDYDGEAIIGAKPESLKCPAHFIQMELQVKDAPKQNEENKKSKNRMAQLAKQLKRNEGLTGIVPFETHQALKEITNAFSREVTCASLSKGVTMGKAKDDGRKAPIYEADTDKKKQRLDFLKNSEIEPKRIRFQELKEYKQRNTKGSSHQKAPEIAQPQIKKSLLDLATVPHPDKNMKVTNYGALLFLLEDEEEAEESAHVLNRPVKGNRTPLK